MPAFYLRCAVCNKDQRRILPKFTEIKCECGGSMQRTDQTNPSTMIKETLDNGVMVRKVERIHNVEELVKERSKPDKDPDFI